MNDNTYTVVIPYYKNRICLEKILIILNNQTKKPDEIIVVDDASPDTIIDILSRFQVLYCKQEKNLGVSAARNKGLHISSSDITIFIDSDAVPEPFFIQTIDEAYKVLGDTVVGIGGRAIECRITNPFDRWRALHLSQDFGLKARNNVPFLFGVCSSYWTSKILELDGFDSSFDENAGEDYDLGIRLGKLGLLMAYSPNIVVNHQHIDNFESLVNSQYRWSYWSLSANIKNKTSTILPWLGHLYRLLKFSFIDLFIHRDLEMFLLGIQIFRKKFAGLYDAARNRQVFS